MATEPTSSQPGPVDETRPSQEDPEKMSDLERDDMPSDEPYELDGHCEENCCPSFWMDEGVPPIPVLSWVFDPKNKYTNDNDYARRFGKMGFVFCDRHRKRFMGAAIAVTVIAIVVTMYGCFALSTDPNVIQWTNWATAWTRNETSSTATKVYLGLVKIVVAECTDVTNDKPWSYDCEVTSDSAWSDVGRSYAEAEGWPWSALKQCREEAESNQFGAFSTCLTLIFALIGALTRIRRAADTNFQKILGCLPDTFGVISLGYSLLTFALGCVDDMPRHVGNERWSYRLGPGYQAYCWCWFAALVRVTMHYLTPTPGHGELFCCETADGSDGLALKKLEMAEKAQLERALSEEEHRPSEQVDRPSGP